jgi:hypothetical protein
MAMSTSHRVLAIPELLDMMFGFMDRASHASNARVCKQWSEVSLTYLWSDVENFHRLFNLLVPLRLTVCGDYVSPPISSVDVCMITRFSRYSPDLRTATIGSALKGTADVYAGYVYRQHSGNCILFVKAFSTTLRGPEQV